MGGENTRRLKAEKRGKKKKQLPRYKREISARENEGKVLNGKEKETIAWIGNRKTKAREIEEKLQKRKKNYCLDRKNKIKEKESEKKYTTKKKINHCHWWWWWIL